MATPMDLHAVAELELEARSRYPWRVKACTSTACQLAGAQYAFDAIEDEIESRGQSRDIQLNPTGCMGMCSQGPLVRVLERGHEETMYQLVDENVGREIISSHIGERTPMKQNVLDHRLPFFALQERVVLTNAGIIDPDRLESAVAHGAYSALEKESRKNLIPPEQSKQRSGLASPRRTAGSWAIPTSICSLR